MTGLNYAKEMLWWVLQKDFNTHKNGEVPLIIILPQDRTQTIHAQTACTGDYHSDFKGLGQFKTWTF